MSLEVTPKRPPACYDEGDINLLNKLPESPYKPHDLCFVTGTTVDDINRRGQHIVLQTPNGSTYHSANSKNICKDECKLVDCLQQARVQWYVIESRILNAQQALDAGKTFDHGHQRALSMDVANAETCLEKFAHTKDPEYQYWAGVLKSVINEARTFYYIYTGEKMNQIRGKALNF